jgi:hypothetical protein
MKIIISIAASFLFISSAWACDESCQRQKAETEGHKFPSYLTWRYCEDLKLDFMTREVKSLQKYRGSQLESQHRGGMNNTRKFLNQRQEWLKECDNYIAKTDKGRLFKDDATTSAIFNSMKSVETELASLIKGVTYSVDSGESASSVAGEKFDRFFKLIDDHQTLMLLKGQVVYR